MKESFFQSIRDEYPNEEVTRLVFADWCLENLPELENKLRTHFPIIDNLNIHPNHGSGNGYRYGHGHGHGSGYGYGYGYGNGHGYAGGTGREYVDGYGYGNGNGSNYQNLKFNMPKLHTNQLIFLSYNFVFCGFVQEHLEPYQLKITKASLIIANHYSSWNEVANNTNRNISIRTFGTITIGPQLFHSIDWIGDLP